MEPKRLFGLILVLLGILFGMRSMELIPEQIEELLFRWELIPIGLGIYLMADRKGTTGIVLFLIGLLFWIPDAFDLPEDLSLWPLVLLLVGLFFLLRGRGRDRSPRSKAGGSHQKDRAEEKDRLKETVIFGNSDRIISTNEFRGGDILSIFGEANIDLTRCQWGEGDREIEVFFLFGGGTLHIPSEWELDLQVIPIFGSFSDKRRQKLEGSGSSSGRIRITGFCIFGDGKIRD